VTARLEESGPALRPDPLFVIGYKRSGTTLLRLILNAHPDVAIPPESEYFQKLPPLSRGRRHGREELEELARGIAELERCDFLLEWTADDVRAIIEPVLPTDAAGLIAALYAAWAKQSGKPHARWGDKKPQHWQIVHGLREWYPAAQFVHLVRDPRDVIGSVEQHMPDQVRGRWLVPHHVITAWQWSLTNREMEAQGAGLGSSRYMSLRYEDLVRVPEEWARKLCAFFRLEFAPEMLSFQETARGQGDLMTSTEGSHHANTQKPVNAGQVGRFKQSLGARESSDVAWICRRDFARYGYVSDVPPPGLLRRLYLGVACAALDLGWRVLRARKRLRGQL